jgi:long-chain acyl-CoA synthetase
MRKMKGNLVQWFEGLGYPAKWLAEAERYAPDDAYVMFDPEWAVKPPSDPMSRRSSTWTAA